MSSNIITTFLGFLNDNSIQIPLIQRDYVQGSAYIEKDIEKRDEFVTLLLNALLPKGKPYMLDFIYGAHEYDIKEGETSPFLPLDGQQRLTTLFLLHWIFSQKADNEGVREKILSILKNFSYKTRISSDRFCNKIIASKFDSQQSLCETIESYTWYNKDMQNDPTVKSMMSMIRLIEDKLKGEEYSSCLQDMIDLLLSEKEERIIFAILDMKEYHLTDGLYVKMNARGKELTEFENWKADFINLLSIFPEYENRFKNSIEHNWNDLFWTGVYRDYSKKVNDITDETKKKEIPYPRIDEHFMNFFFNISRLLFFIKSTKEKPDASDYNPSRWSCTETLYKNHPDMVKLLFDMLDILCEIENEGGIEGFFEDLIVSDSNDICEEKGNKVVVNGVNPNLFKTTYENSKQGRLEHILLFSILTYCVKFKIKKANDNLRNYLRICRNYLSHHNYLDSSTVSIAPQIRANEMSNYMNVFEYLQTDQDPYVSLKPEYNGKEEQYIKVEKTILNYCGNKDVLNLCFKLSDSKNSYCNIGSFKTVLDDCYSGTYEADDIWECYKEFSNTRPITKVQLFVAYGYKGIGLGNCAYGNRVLIGSNFRNNDYWNLHFIKNATATNTWFSALFKDYLHTRNLNDLIEKKKKAYDIYSIEYYFLNYPEFAAAQVTWKNNQDTAPYYYAMPDPFNDIDMIVIHSFSSRPLGNSYQTCPMAYAVYNRLVDKDKTLKDQKRIGTVGQGSYKNGIYILKDDQEILNLRFGKHNWYVNSEDYTKLDSSLIGLFESKPSEKGNYRLKREDGKDLIQLAEDFLANQISLLRKKNIIP